MQNKGSLKYYRNYPLSLVSTIGTGGRADFYVTPYDLQTLIAAVNEAEKHGKYIVIGNASNLIFDDRGFYGTVLSTVKIRALGVIRQPRNEEEKVLFSRVESEEFFYATCGTWLPSLSLAALNLGYSGFEGLCSIPATVGGAVCSNAGAFGCEISDNLVALQIYRPTLKKTEMIFRDSMLFSYRKSSVGKCGEIVLCAYFAVKKGSKTEIREKIEQNKRKRTESQPMGVKSAGSYFKKPDPSDGKICYRGKSAGELIDLCGMKGYKVGGAQVSGKHGNFIINATGLCRTADIKALARSVKRKVYAKCGIKLKEEVEYIPYSGKKSGKRKAKE